MKSLIRGIILSKALFLIKTYGCQMNVHESEKLAGMLISLGYQPCEKEADADIIVFNTCAIRDSAEQKIFGNVGAVKNLKIAKPNLIVAVCGCMAQMKGRAEIFKKKYPFVNIVFGTHNANQFKNYLLRYQNHKENIYEIWDTEKEISENVEMYRASDYNAWLNIMYGCNNFCTFCIVPHVRGRERSRAFEDIISDAKKLISQGFKFITLLGQNVNSYGNDLKDENINFASLLEAIACLEGDFKIKFMTSHPKDLTLDVINTIAKCDKISKYIHLPVQSGSNRVLKAMNRNYTVEHYNALISEIKQTLPNAFISTDIIVGFPTETHDEFMETYDLVEQIRYDGVFAFIYSPRTGTPAEQMEQVPKEIKKARINQLLKRSKEISREKTQEMLGKTYNAIFEKVGFINDNKYAVCAVDSGKNILVPMAENAHQRQGNFYNVKIVKIEKNKVFAEFA